MLSKEASKALIRAVEIWRECLRKREGQSYEAPYIMGASSVLGRIKATEQEIEWLMGEVLDREDFMPTPALLSNLIQTKRPPEKFVVLAAQDSFISAFDPLTGQTVGAPPRKVRNGEYLAQGEEHGNGVAFEGETKIQVMKKYLDKFSSMSIKFALTSQLINGLEEDPVLRAELERRSDSSEEQSESKKILRKIV